MAKRFIISGGGTGGHIYPAISIANSLRELCPDCEILFVGAEGKMEMDKVPEAGYEIKGLPIMGLPRSLSTDLIRFIFKWIKSKRLAKKIIKNFKPDAAIGVGGYASGPLLNVAEKNGIITIIQEQNSYAGVTNKLLAKKAQKICVAYDNMHRFFPKDKIVLTGNPIRKGLLTQINTDDARAYFGIKTNRPVISILGGSLGARSINDAVLASLKELEHIEAEIIWQTGKFYYNEMISKTEGIRPKNVHVVEFISRMDYVFGLTNLVVSRAGASTISELCVIGMPSILVPSPNVAEDHQTKNAKALSDKDAALFIKDADVTRKLAPTLSSTIADASLLANLRSNILKLAKPNASEDIARIILNETNK